MTPYEIEQMADNIMRAVNAFNSTASPPEIYFALALVQAEFIRKFNSEMLARK